MSNLDNQPPTSDQTPKKSTVLEFMWSGLSVHACQTLWIQIKSHLATTSSKMTNDDDQDERPDGKANGSSCAVRRKPITSIERTRKLSILLKHHQRYAVSSFDVV